MYILSYLDAYEIPEGKVNPSNASIVSNVILRAYDEESDEW